MVEQTTHDELDLLVCEYVIGLLDEEERTRVGQLIDTNGTARMLADLWEERLAPLNDEFETVPSPNIWPALDRILFARQRRRNIIFWVVIAGFMTVIVAKITLWVWLLT